MVLYVCFGRRLGSSVGLLMMERLIIDWIGDNVALISYSCYQMRANELCFYYGSFEVEHAVNNMLGDLG